MDLDQLLKIVTLIGAVSTTGIALATFILAQQIKTATDGMKTELVAVTRSDALQTGKTEGKADEKAAQALRDIKKEDNK